MSGSSVGSGGVDFHLSDEILSVIPTDPYEQLDLARKITSMAIAGRVTRLEADCARLRQRLSERERTVSELEERVAQLDGLVHEYDGRLRTALEDNAKLLKEKDLLAVTSKKLSRNLAKLETFKKQLVQSLSDDNLNHSERAGANNDDNLVARISSLKVSDVDDLSSGQTVPDHASASTSESSQDGYQFSITPYITPRLTPTSTPKISSTSGSPRAFATVGSSPKVISGSVSPAKLHPGGHSTIPPVYPSEQKNYGTTSPPKRQSFAGRPRIDGKEFFRQARSRLSYEQFGAFLANIKEFNAQKQSREETLQKAEQIFELENKDLFISFQNLINRNQPGT